MINKLKTYSMLTMSIFLLFGIAFVDSTIAQVVAASPEASPIIVANQAESVKPEVLILITAILGMVMPFLTMSIKRVAGTDGRITSLLSLVISFALAFFALFVFGQISLGNIAATVGLVYSVGNVVYNQAFKNYNWTVDEPEN